jgi:ABC-type bacteriocin/lantibiotic exporter with double-glycine peptidase domain
MFVFSSRAIETLITFLSFIFFSSLSLSLSSSFTHITASLAAWYIIISNSTQTSLRRRKRNEMMEEIKGDGERQTRAGEREGVNSMHWH